MKNKKGFTLPVLLIVVVLAAVAVPVFDGPAGPRGKPSVTAL